MSDNQQTCVGEALTLAELAAALLAEARTRHAHRAGRTILTGSSMRATLIALAEKAELAEHEAPPAATLQVLSGEVELIAGADCLTVVGGQITAIPSTRHALVARTDAVVLLTVALH